MKGAKEVRIFYYRLVLENFIETHSYLWTDQIKSTWFSLLPIERPDLAEDKMLIVRNKNNQLLQKEIKIENSSFFFKFFFFPGKENFGEAEEVIILPGLKSQ